MSQKTPLSRIKKISLAESFTNFTQSHFYAQKLLLHVPFFAVRKNFHLYKPKVTESLRTALKSCPFTYKSSSFAQAFPCWFQKTPIFTNQKHFFCTNLSLLLSKAILFHPPPPLSTPLNLLFAKNTAVLLQSALILCCKAGASHRFKSLPAIPDEVAVFSIAGYLMNAGHFRFKTVSTGDLNRGRRTESRVLFGYFLHDAKSDNPFSLAGSFEVPQTLNQHTAAAASHRNN